MTRDAGFLRHTAASLALPFTVTVIVPAALLTGGTFNPAWGSAFPINVVLLLLGIGMIALGLTLIVLTVRLFATVGRGTLAPWDPTRRLVVRGVYRYVRNPMISGVGSVLLGEMLIAGSPPLLLWMLAFIIVNMIYIPLSEEPGLRARFGGEYEVYTQQVPRWIPRRTPWQPPEIS